MKWEKIGLVYDHLRSPPLSWWASHAMAPTAILLNPEVIRVYLGSWDEKGISRIGWIDVDAKNPTTLLNRSSTPSLDLGRPGSFDENGVFPGHISKFNNKFYLHYTGFQLGYQVPHFNFGGLAISDDGSQFIKVSEAPILDRADEGLCVRAGASSLFLNNKLITVYSAGSDWIQTGGKLRPCYDIFLQETNSLLDFQKAGVKIIAHNPSVEHGLGRPQIFQLNGNVYIFYTRRILGMKYFFGYAKYDYKSNLCTRQDHLINISHSSAGNFDSEMIYFPSVVSVPHLNRVYLFYSGNNFGGSGLGVLEMFDE